MIRYLLPLLLVLFGSCSKVSPVLSQYARLSLTSDPTTLDPRRARDLDSTTLIHMLFEGLTRTSQAGEVELAMASRVDISHDGLRYTFHLRKSLWSDGVQMTAFDFANNWKTILDPNFATDIAYQLYPIKNAKKAKLGEVAMESVGIYVPDERTLVVDLEDPLPYFLELLSLPAFFPVPLHIVYENADWNLSPETLVSNGPFILGDWKHSDRLTLLKNPRYWEAKSVRLARVDFLIATPDTALRMFEEGQLDWTGSPLSTIPADAVQHLKQTDRLQVSPFSGTYFYRVNTSPEIGGKRNPLADPATRRALAYAINREEIVQHVLQGGQIPAKSYVPPEMGLSGDFLNGPKPDLDGIGPITISYSNNSERNAAVAQAVQKQWEDAFGIQVALEAVEPKTFFQRISKKEYQIAAGSWTADFNDPVNFLEVFKFKGSSTNNTGWENARYTELLDRSATVRGAATRKRILQEAEAILMQEMPILPVFHFILNYAKNEELSGVYLSPLGQIDLRRAYFESSEPNDARKR